MKNKVLTIILFLSCSLLSFLVTINFINRDFKIENIKDEDIKVFSNFNNKIKACYGNKMKCYKAEYKIIGDVDSNKVGKYNMKYVVKYKNKTKTFKKIVNVIDDEKPELNVDGDFNNVCPNGTVSNLIISAKDNYDGDISDKIEYKMENNKIVYKVEDSSSNTTKKEIDIIINDNEKPKLLLNGDSTLYLVEGNTYKEPGYTAIDNCEGDITKNVKVTNKLDTSKAGTYEITYEVEDSYKNKETKKRTVKVYKKNNYEAIGITGKTVYLTFDDGPGPYTEKLLGILNKYNVKATFFVTGYNNNYNHLLKKESDDGHTVALHSYTHDYSKIYASEEAYMSDLTRIQNKVRDYTGITSTIIRFPGGSSNTVSRKYNVGIMTKLTKDVEDIGFRYFDWTISSGDAGNTTSSTQIVKNVTSNITPNGANVVLMHDIKSYTVNAIEDIIKYGLSNGYTFAPLTMQSPVVHQKVNN